MKQSKLVVTVVDHDQHRSKAHTFTRGPVRIGRDPENELHLAYRFVSSWHAVIKLRRPHRAGRGPRHRQRLPRRRHARRGRQERRGPRPPRGHAIGPIELIVEHTPAETRRPASAEPVPTPSELLHVRDRRSAQGAIDSDEPALLSSGHTDGDEPVEGPRRGAQAAPAVRAASARPQAGVDEGPRRGRPRAQGDARRGRAGAAAPRVPGDRARRRRRPGDRRRRRRRVLPPGRARRGRPGRRGAGPRPARPRRPRGDQALPGAGHRRAADLRGLDGRAARGDGPPGPRARGDASTASRTRCSRPTRRTSCCACCSTGAAAGPTARTSWSRRWPARWPIQPRCCAVRWRPAARSASSSRRGRSSAASASAGRPAAGALWRRFEERYESLFGDGEDGWSRALRGQAAQAVNEALGRLGVPLLASESDDEDEEESE
jgi:hypothetical protein